MPPVAASPWPAAHRGRSLVARRAGACVALAALAVAPVRHARGQSRAGAPDAGTAAPSPAAPPSPPVPRCTLRARPLVPDEPAAAPDPRVAPAAIATDDGLLVVWRATDGVLRVSRLGPTFDRLGHDRELARPGGPFAAAAGPGGAAVALVERSAARGSDAVLFARLTGAGEARNVPRELGRAERIDGVAIAWAGTGYAVAWGAHTGGSAGTFVVLTDPRGVPRTPARRLLDATTPRLAYLPAVDTVVVSATSETGEPTVASLDGAGQITGTARWPANARALLVAPSGASALGLVTTGAAAAEFAGAPLGAGAASTVYVPRWTNDGTRVDIPVALRLAPGATVASVVPDRGGLVAAFDEPAARRELVVRVGIDGVATLLAVRPGWLGAIVPGADATAFTVVGHEPPPAGQGRLAIVQLACPRPPAVLTPAAPTGPQAATGVSTAPNAASVTPGSDAGMAESALASRAVESRVRDASSP